MSEQLTILLTLPYTKETLPYVKEGGEKIKLEYEKRKPFFEQLISCLEKEGHSFSLCGGKGICGKCKICYVDGAPIPTAGERKFLSPEELRKGIRLACFSHPVKECEIEILFTQNVFIAEEFTLKEQSGKALSIKSSDEECEQTIIAVDIGTTTIAMTLRDLETSAILDTYAAVNPQRKYGADVIARIEAACEGRAEELKESVLSVIRNGIAHFHDQGSVIYVAANTVMNHLLTGSDVSKLGKTPFQPAYLERKEFQVNGKKGIVLPGVSAFVGGDITAGMISCAMLPVKQENRGKLLIDLGTNGEMALCDGSQIYTTATAAGPAFEGGSEEVKIGSNMVHYLAEMLKQEIMDETGLLQEPYFTEGYQEAGVKVTQRDVRNLQLAKAAVRVGIEILMKKAGLRKEEITQVYLAGGFGYRMDVEEAVIIGLIPEEFKQITLPVGNSALEGAFAYAKWEISDEEEKRELLESVSKVCQSINLAEEPGFLEQYVEEMNFQVPKAYIV